MRPVDPVEPVFASGLHEEGSEGSEETKQRYQASFERAFGVIFEDRL